MGLHQTQRFGPQVHCFCRLFKRSKRGSSYLECKIIWKWSEGKQKLLRVSRMFKLSRVRVTEGNITECIKEIQGKSIMVRVSEGSSYRESTVNKNSRASIPEKLHHCQRSKSDLHGQDSWHGTSFQSTAWSSQGSFRLNCIQWNHRRFLREGFSPQSNLLPFYIPVLT